MFFMISIFCGSPQDYGSKPDLVGLATEGEGLSKNTKCPEKDVD